MTSPLAQQSNFSAAPLSGLTDRVYREQIEGLKQRSLRRFHYALASRNSEPCDIFFCAGDSITASYGASRRSNFLSQKFVNYLRYLHPQVAAGGPGFMSAAVDYSAVAAPLPDAPQSGTVGVTYSPANGFPCEGLDSAAAVLNAAGQARSYTFTGTGFDFTYYLYCIQQGSAALTVDGVNYGTISAGVTPSGGTSAGGYVNITPGAGNVTTFYSGMNNTIQAKVRGLTAGSHTVTFTWATGNFWLFGLTGYNGDENSGIRVTQQAWSGRGTRNYVGSTYGAGAQNEYPPGGVGSAGNGNNAEQWLRQIAQGYYLPDLVILDNFANDYGGTATDLCSPAQNLANHRSLISQIKAAVVAGTTAQGLPSYIPSFIMMPPQCVITSNIGGPSGNGTTMVANWQDYVANAYTLALTDSDGAVGVFDLGQRLQGISNTWDNSTYQGLLWTDHVHPSDAGNDWLARSLATFVSPA